MCFHAIISLVHLKKGSVLINKPVEKRNLRKITHQYSHVILIIYKRTIPSSIEWRVFLSCGVIRCHRSAQPPGTGVQHIKRTIPLFDIGLGGAAVRYAIKGFCVAHEM
jgi:hypothetical protein